MNKLQVKYLNLLQEYSNEVSEANYPYSEKSGQYPEKHPFEMLLPKFLMMKN